MEMKTTKICRLNDIICHFNDIISNLNDIFVFPFLNSKMEIETKEYVV